MHNVVYENNEFVICEKIEIIPLYEDGSYETSYKEVIHISKVFKIEEDKACIKYYYKLDKLKDFIEPLNPVMSPLKVDVMWDKINEIIEYINR